MNLYLGFTTHDVSLCIVSMFQGDAPLVGCVLALACDYRIMVNGPYSIGLNETKEVGSHLTFKIYNLPILCPLS